MKICFSRAEILEFVGILVIFTGLFVYFFLGQGLFFLGLNLAVFFSGKNLSSRAVFEIFSREDFKLLGHKIENFLGLNFCFLGEKKTLQAGIRERP